MSDKPNNNVPTIGSRHYHMDGLSFYINRTPKDVIQEWLLAAIKQLQESGNFGLAKELTANPQPFYGQPHAMAVFMAASAELDKSNARIDALEQALAVIGGAFAAIPEDPTQLVDDWFSEHLRPAMAQAMEVAGLKPGSEAAGG